MLIIAAVLLFFSSTSSALYHSSTNVVSLTTSNFDSLVVQSDYIWVVQFYAPWCGHSKAMVPEFSKAATALKGIVKVGAVDCDVDKALAGRYGVKGFPTVKIFGADKAHPIDYNGARTAQAIVESALDAARRKVQSNIPSAASNREVVELTDDNFASIVYGSKDFWLVEFFSPGCGYCQKLAPEWADAANQLKGKAKLGAIDATKQSIIPSTYNIQGYPTIYFFEPGSKGKQDGKIYNGGRTSSEIVNWIIDRIQEKAPPPEVVQLTEEKNLKEQCSNNPLCVIAVLPHILDCQSTCRNNYISMLTKVAEKYKRKMWGWLWVEAGAQPELEESLDIGGFGYPAMAVLNSKKLKFSLLKGSFSEDGISEFLRDLSFGRGRTQDLKQLPNIVTTEPWNGEDQALPEEEEIDLSDVVLDDIKEEL